MNHQKLKCYAVLIGVAQRVPALTRMLPKGNWFLEDQLKRALGSAVLNLAEGNGRRSTKERNRFFDIALASIAEASAAIDLIGAYGYIPAEMQQELQEMLRQAYCMLFRLKR